MSSSHSLELGLAALLSLAFSASDASAQSRVGRQWLTTGLSVAPGIVTDSTADEVGLSPVSAMGGLRLRLGFQHVIARQFVMAAEVELGDGWIDTARLAPAGLNDSSHHFAWQAGLMGRWLPRGNAEGPALGAGLHTYRAGLPEAPLQTLSGDIRAGWYLWRNDKFVLAEIGYSPSLLSGLDLPATFGTDAPEPTPKNWTVHRFVIGFSYGF
jgi:hypothetical protein